MADPAYSLFMFKKKYKKTLNKNKKQLIFDVEYKYSSDTKPMGVARGTQTKSIFCPNNRETLLHNGWHGNAVENTSNIREIKDAKWNKRE